MHCVLLIHNTNVVQMTCFTALLSFRLFSVKRGPPSKNDECLEISHLFRKWLTSTQSFWMHVIASIVSFWGEASQKYGIPSQPDSQHSYGSGFVVFRKSIKIKQINLQIDSWAESFYYVKYGSSIITSKISSKFLNACDLFIPFFVFGFE